MARGGRLGAREPEDGGAWARLLFPGGSARGLSRACSTCPSGSASWPPFPECDPHTRVIRSCLPWAPMCTAEGLAHLGPHLEGARACSEELQDPGPWRGARPWSSLLPRPWEGSPQAGNCLKTWTARQPPEHIHAKVSTQGPWRGVQLSTHRQ